MAAATEDSGDRLRVRVTPAFWIMAMAPGVEGGARGMLSWVSILFLSLFVHELGQALAGLSWGSRAVITLHLAGGRTEFTPALPARRAVLATLLGSLGSFAMAAFFAAARIQHGPLPALTTAVWVNCVWGAINLLPVLPFSAGRALQAHLGERAAGKFLMVSAVIAFAIAEVCLWGIGDPLLTTLFGAAAVMSLLDWVRHHRTRAEQASGVPDRLARAERLLARGVWSEARALAVGVAQDARLNETEVRALEIAAWCELGLGRAERARNTISSIRPVDAVDVYCWAAVEDACGNSIYALRGLEAAHARRRLGRDANRFLIDLCARVRGVEEACRVTLRDLDNITAEDARQVLEFAIQAQYPAGAKAISDALHGSGAAEELAPVSQPIGVTLR